MEKFKSVAVIQAIVIAILLLLLFNGSAGNNWNHCEKFINPDGTFCLLSPMVYTGMLPPESHLIFSFKPLQEDVKNYLKGRGADASVYVLNMKDGASFGINSTKPYKALSLNKLPVAIIILKKVEQGELRLDTVLTIEPQDRDNKSGTLYANPADGLSVRELLRYMLSESDNTALNVLTRQESIEDLHKISVYLNYYTDDVPFLEPPFNDSFEITPKSTANVFLSLYTSSILNPEDSEMIISDLENNSFDVKKYAGLPDNVIVSHKYGSYFNDKESLFHDCGIMYIRESRIFYCIMTKGLDQDRAVDIVGTTVNKIYNFVSEAQKTKNTNII